MSFTIPARPTTKKTSSQIVGFGKPCYVCHKRPYQKVIPSDIYLEFEDACYKLGPIVRNSLESRGVALPIAGPVSVRALFYREADRGDYNGFTQALADVLQAPIFDGGKVRRKGMGIIEDDRQIQHFDGTRLLKDAARPRIEVVITVIDPPLFAEAT